MASEQSALGGERASACVHCGAPVPSENRSAFCCNGCEAVHAFLSSEGLDRYYELRPRDGLPARPDTERDHKWLEPLALFGALKDRLGDVAWWDWPPG